MSKKENTKEKAAEKKARIEEFCKGFEDAAELLSLEEGTPEYERFKMSYAVEYGLFEKKAEHTAKHVKNMNVINSPGYFANVSLAAAAGTFIAGAGLIGVSYLVSSDKGGEATTEVNSENQNPFADTTVSSPRPLKAAK